MPAISASAPGKIILFGEHAVVYGRPAIAIPVEQVRAKAIISAKPNLTSGSILIQAPNIKFEGMLADLPPDNPLAAAVWGVFNALEIPHLPAMAIRISSTIPIAAGMGSGAATSIAIIRALSGFLGHPFSNQQVSDLAFEIEKIHHGTPSGIDNTVITLRQPIFFQRISMNSIDVDPIYFPQPFIVVIADTGISTPTSVTVGDVRSAWNERPEHYESIFDNLSKIVRQARREIESGQLEIVGDLMNANQQLLRELGVSSPELEKLVQISLDAGAWGAKLSGGGRGGNMIALSNAEIAPNLVQALLAAGAHRVIETTLQENIQLKP